MPKVNSTNADAVSLLDFSYEQSLLGQYKAIVGIDEVGRGPLAGPVTAAAVVIKNPEPLLMVNDSKTLSAKKRDTLYDLIWQNAHVAVAHASVAEIDSLNILQATFVAMCRAVEKLQIKLAEEGASLGDYAIIDGNKIPQEMPLPAECVVKGDAKVLSVAAASIIAKVTRDRIMAKLAQEHPHFGWESNAGYGSRIHMDALKEHGPTPWHRHSFAPVASAAELHNS